MEVHGRAVVAVGHQPTAERALEKAAVDGAVAGEPSHGCADRGGGRRAIDRATIDDPIGQQQHHIARHVPGRAGDRSRRRLAADQLERIDREISAGPAIGLRKLSGEISRHRRRQSGARRIDLASGRMGHAGGLEDLRLQDILPQAALDMGQGVTG